MLSAVSAAVSGRVQMVMFRDFTTRKARALGLVGEVENMPDGTVRVYAEGEEEPLARFVEFLKKGSVLSKVENVQFQFVQPTGQFSSFSIKY
jgi:acylphosphatase